MIPIQNVYYMLSYAFSTLQENEYKSIETEKFKNVSDICAAILIKGVSLQIKKGLHKEYIGKTQPLICPKGKFDISETVKTMSMLKHQIVCSFDEYTENSNFNRIIKTTMNQLLRRDISLNRKKEIKKLLMFFSNVDIINPQDINWRLSYNRNNRNYRLLISVCYLAIKELIQTTSEGKLKTMDFLDEQKMCRLYEKFILEYYKKEYRGKVSANSTMIAWGLSDDLTETVDNMLPKMQSDIMLTKGNKVLIIDAKYYSRTTQKQFDKHTFHSNNLYQIFAYVKNKEYELKDREHIPVSGMLLYARTDEEIQPDNDYMMSGNMISVKTLDLNCEFKEIAAQLNNIADTFIQA